MGTARILGALALALAATLGCSGSASSAPPEPSREPAGKLAVPDPVAAETQPEPAGTRPARDTTDQGAAAEGEDSPDAGADGDPADEVDDGWIARLLAAYPRKFRTLLEDPARYRLQILVSVLPRRKGTRRIEHGYRVGVEYIYPASAIKTFASVAALRKLEDLRAQGHRVGVDTPVRLCKSEHRPHTRSDGKTKGSATTTPEDAPASRPRPRKRRCVVIEEDPSNLAGGVITLGHEIRKMQLVSNNIAFNRLYEFVGHREINEMLWSLGFDEVRIHHRMYGIKDPEVQRTTPRFELRPLRGEPVVIPHRVSDLILPDTHSTSLKLGIGYIDDDNLLVEEPLDFAGKNYSSVRDLHMLTLALARPGLPGVPDLGLDEADRKFLLRAMTDDPLESENPVYTNPKKSGLHYHTLSKGIERVLPLDRITYAGKAGRAYGFHLDNAYIEDTKTGRAMVVTATAYANANGVLNDNKYEYDGITRPLLKNLGEVLARHVLLDKPLPQRAE